MHDTNHDVIFIDPNSYKNHYYRVALMIDSYREIEVYDDSLRKRYLKAFIISLSQLYQYEFELMQAIKYPLISSHADDHDIILEYVKDALEQTPDNLVPLKAVAKRISQMMVTHAHSLDEVLNEFIHLKYYSPALDHR